MAQFHTLLIAEIPSYIRQNAWNTPNYYKIALELRESQDFSSLFRAKIIEKSDKCIQIVSLDYTCIISADQIMRIAFHDTVLYVSAAVS